VQQNIKMARSAEDERRSQLQRLNHPHRLQQAVINAQNAFAVLMDAMRC
jgi:hypothetical protein